MNLSGADLKLLEKIHRCFLEIEKTAKDQQFAQECLENLKAMLLDCQNSDSIDLKRLSEIPKHLHPDMSLKHFVGFLVPVERLLHKKLRDDEFVITFKDRTQTKSTTLPLVFVLDNIRSAFNVGSIFRTAECLNIEKIFLCGYTPNPDHEKVDKTAMGTEELLPWQSVAKIEEAIDILRKQGYRIVALETATKTKDLYQDFQQIPTAFVFGNERFGLDLSVLGQADEVREIPLRGQKNSLNVGITAAVAGFEWVRQWNQPKSL